MNREQAKALLPIIQAYADGAEVEYCSICDVWSPVKRPSFAESLQWRIAKPKLWYRNFLTNDGVEVCQNILSNTESYWEQQEYFVCWLGERQYYNIT